MSLNKPFTKLLEHLETLFRILQKPIIVVVHTKPMLIAIRATNNQICMKSNQQQVLIVASFYLHTARLCNCNKIEIICKKDME